MKKMTILSVVTASLFIIGCGDTATEEISSELVTQKGAITKSVEDMHRLANTKVTETAKHESSKSEPKAESKAGVAQKIESIGESKTVGEIITASVGVAAVATKTVTKSSDVFDYKLEAKKVAENVWCFFGALDKPTKENAGNMVNGCYIKTNDGYLVMDTGPSYAYAKQTYEVMSKIADLPVKYVVNSHEHDDHWLGNDFYKKKFGAKLIGPESINTNYKDGDKTRMYNVLPENAIKGTHIVKLDEIVKETQTLKFGGEEFQIIPMDVKAHTGDDVFIYMPKRKVLFAGDLVMNGRITSGRHGSVMGQLKALAIMKKLDWKVMIPGHGVITDATAMDEAQLYFDLTKERILEAIDEGVDATEINEVVKLIEFKDKAMYDILNAHNIGFAFDELEMVEDDEEEETPAKEEKAETTTAVVPAVPKVPEVPSVEAVVTTATVAQKLVSTDKKKSIGTIITEATSTTREARDSRESRVETKVVVKTEVKEEVKAEPKAEAKSTDAFDYKLTPEKVNENIWCFFGALDKPTKENAGNMVNGCYVKTSEGYLVMDTGPSYQYAKQAYEAMAKIEALPVKYVINSHEHDDHWLGNDFYKKKFGAKLIGPKSVNTEYKAGDKTRMFNVLPENAIKGTNIIKLDETPTKKYTLEFGGEKFDIIPMDVKAHTNDDIFVYMPERRVLFAGDLVMNGRITSGRHGSVMGQLKALEMMNKLNWKIMIPGHGFITDKRAMDEASMYFNLTKERILKAIDDDVDATTINEVVKLKEFKDKAMYDILNAHNVGFAFDELEMLE